MATPRFLNSYSGQRENNVYKKREKLLYEADRDLRDRQKSKIREGIFREKRKG